MKITSFLSIHLEVMIFDTNLKNTLSNIPSFPKQDLNMFLENLYVVDIQGNLNSSLDLGKTQTISITDT